MAIEKVTEKDEFNRVAVHPLQSWEWGKFRKATGNEVVRFPFGQVTLHKIPFTNFKVGAFIKGPMPTYEMIKELLRFAREHNLIFIKLEPNYVIKKGGITCADEKRVVNLLRKNGATPGKTLFTPTSFWIDLTKTEDELLKSFSSKTRYNIRLALKKGVEIVEDNTKAAFNR